MVSKIESDRYADTGFSVADTPADLNQYLFEQMMAKSGEERLKIGCSIADSARDLVWSGIPKELDERERRKIFFRALLRGDVSLGSLGVLPFCCHFAMA